MSSRYATIITGDDGREVVSAIGAFEGAAPRARVGRIEPVAAGVRIGMVRGGLVDAVGGFGFAERLSGNAVGLILAKLKALPEAARRDAAKSKPKARPTRAKRAKSRKRPVRKMAAKPAIAAPAGIAG